MFFEGAVRDVDLFRRCQWLLVETIGNWGWLYHRLHWVGCLVIKMRVPAVKGDRLRLCVTFEDAEGGGRLAVLPLAAHTVGVACMISRSTSISILFYQG